jgi:hypothetical protein
MVWPASYFRNKLPRWPSRASNRDGGISGEKQSIVIKGEDHMLKLGLAAIAATELMIVQAAAATSSPFPFWVGTAVVDSATAACANGGFVATNDIISSDYRAKTGVAGEPNNPGIMFILSRSSMALFRTGGSANAKTMNGSGNYGGYLIKGNVTTIPNPSQQPFTGTFTLAVTPATVTKTTDAISINGTINNWRNVSGCTVKFRAAYRRGN